MNEKEAKTKWCPMVRHSDSEESANNRCGGAVVTSWNSCIASDCAMWVWDTEYIETEKSPIPDIVNFMPMPVQSKTNGHCGLIR